MTDNKKPQTYINIKHAIITELTYDLFHSDGCRNLNWQDFINNLKEFNSLVTKYKSKGFSKANAVEVFLGDYDTRFSDLGVNKNNDFNRNLEKKCDLKLLHKNIDAYKDIIDKQQYVPVKSINKMDNPSSNSKSEEYIHKNYLKIQWKDYVARYFKN